MWSDEKSEDSTAEDKEIISNHVAICFVTNHNITPFEKCYITSHITTSSGSNNSIIIISKIHKKFQFNNLSDTDFKYNTENDESSFEKIQEMYNKIISKITWSLWNQQIFRWTGH